MSARHEGSIPFTRFQTTSSLGGAAFRRDQRGGSIAAPSPDGRALAGCAKSTGYTALPSARCSLHPLLLTSHNQVLTQYSRPKE